MPKLLVCRDDNKKSRKLAETSMQKLKVRLKEFGDGSWTCREYNTKMTLDVVKQLVEKPFKLEGVKDYNLVVSGNRVKVK